MDADKVCDSADTAGVRLVTLSLEQKQVEVIQQSGVPTMSRHDEERLEEAYMELELELLEQPDNPTLVYYQAVILARKHHEKRRQYEAMTGRVFRV